MRLRVLGCHGGELPKHKTTCFLLDEKLVLDAGALTSSLPLEALCQIDDIILSHSHFDHVKDLPLLADLVMGIRRSPIRVHASKECIATLRTHMFNDFLWPDFTRIPSEEAPIIQVEPFEAGSSFKIGEYHIQSIPVSHPVESCGFVVTRGGVSVAMSGDTGPTEELWRVLNRTTNLKAILLETSFPNRLQPLAEVSGHLTPGLLKIELDKLTLKGAQILLYHLKPAYVSELKRELKGMPVEVLELGDTFEF